jgi:glycosyltransferase involved in cell wall biosynthesis
MVSELFPELFNNAGSERAREQKRRCVLSADAVICISESTRQDVLRLYGVDPDKVIVVPLACGDVFKQHINISQETESPVPGPFLLYVGSRSQYKNFWLLIEAYSSWPRRDEVSLVVAGGSWSAQEMENLRARGIYQRVRLLNKVDDEALCSLYNMAAAFVYPSLYEGFGIPLLEAMACGCPVIASRIPSTIEVAGDCPVYFEPGETEGLVAALDIALSEGRDSRRTRAGLEHVKNFSWQRTAEDTLKVYRSLSHS